VVLLVANYIYVYKPDAEVIAEAERRRELKLRAKKCDTDTILGDEDGEVMHVMIDSRQV
jgi:hypothetical protein